MDWLLKLVIIWLSFDILTLATVWYAVNVIKPRCPHWWKQVVVDIEPKSEGLVSSYRSESPQYQHVPSHR